MYTLANAGEKTSIAVLKSDIFQVHLRLQKIKNLANIGQRSQSRRRSEISAIQKGTSEVEKIIKSFPSDDVDKLRYQLVLLLNQKMIELESTVFNASLSPSMSRLPVWLKLLDRHIEMCSPELMSRPASRSSRPASRSSMYPPSQAVNFDSLQRLLKRHSIDCSIKSNSPGFLTSAVAALEAKMQD